MNTNFFGDVYDVVRLIPKGRVTNYGAIANFLGSRISARMVGWAMNAAHGMNDIPAQRVVNHVGLLTGKMHFETPSKMQELLEEDGLLIENDQVKDFKKCFWDPAVELEI